MKHPIDTWIWQGLPGHFIMGNRCRFHLTTKIGPWLVSTVGEYLPAAEVREIIADSRGKPLEGRGDARVADWLTKFGYEEIGHERLYETMVFRCNSAPEPCGCFTPTDYTELECHGYNDHTDANAGHMAVCVKYAELDATDIQGEEE